MVVEAKYKEANKKTHSLQSRADRIQYPFDPGVGRVQEPSQCI